MKNQASIDSIGASGGNIMANGDTAMRLLQSGFDTSALRTNAVLRKDEWLAVDNAVLEVAHQRLGAVETIVGRGLRTDISNGLGTTQLEWESSSDMTEPDVNMSGVTEGERDRVEYSLSSMPLPIIHKDFRINIRALEASRSRGLPLDTTQASMATRLVSEKIEGIMFTGASTTVLGGTVYGLENHPNRNTGSVTANWNTATGEQIIADTLAMINGLYADNQYGPFGIYLPVDAYANLSDDYKAASDKTTMQRLMEIPGIEFIQPTSSITAGSVIMIQLSSDVIDYVIGMQPTVLQWESMGGMVVNFKVMAIMLPRIRSDFENQSGVMHYS